MLKLLISCSLVAICLAGEAAIAQDLKVEHIRIDLDAKAGRKLPKGKKKDAYLKNWKSGCTKIGTALTAGKGPYGFGAFGSFGCYRGGKLVAGDDRPSKWQLHVVDAVADLRLSLTHADTAGGEAAVLSEYTLPPSEYSVQFFKDEEFVDLVVYALLSDAPVGMLVTKAQVSGDPPQFKTRYWRAGKAKDFKYEVPEAPEDLVLYRLRWDEPTKAWKSTVVGSAKRTKVTPPKKKKGKKGSTLEGGQVTYQTSPAVSEALAEGALWAQSAAGPGAIHQEMSDNLREAQIDIAAAAQSGQLGEFLKGNNDLLTSLLKSAASGYVGLRYGREVLPGAGGLGALLHKTAVFGLLVEIRGGPAKGLRYRYDLLPKAEANVPGTNGPVNTSIQFSRHTLGYSFGFDPHWLVDRITVDPRIGIWTFNATLPAAVDENNLVSDTADFKLGTTLSLGGELGLEELSDWYTIRAWYGINTGISLLKTGGKVTSNQFGIDAFLTGGPVIPLFGVPLKTALMLFYFYEAVTLTSNKATGDLAPGQSAISGLSYSVGYAGLGAALSW